MSHSTCTQDVTNRCVCACYRCALCLSAFLDCHWRINASRNKTKFKMITDTIFKLMTKNIKVFFFFSSLCSRYYAGNQTEIVLNKSWIWQRFSRMYRVCPYCHLKGANTCKDSSVNPNLWHQNSLETHNVGLQVHVNQLRLNKNGPLC